MEQKKNSLPHLNSDVEKIVLLAKLISKNLKEQFYERAKQLGFTVPQLMLIFALKAHSEITLHELSEQLHLSKGTVSGIVDRLVIQGVVIREIPKDNRRIVKLSLSPEFCNNNDIMDIKNQYFKELFEKASLKDMEIIIAGLEKLSYLIK